MIALPGLTLATGRPDVAARILRTFARFVDRGMLPNRFPDGGEAPEYNTVDATLWYFEAIRAYHAATGDDALLKELYPVLEDIVGWHRTRHALRHRRGSGRRPAPRRRAGRAAHLDGRQGRRLGGDARGSASRSRSTRSGTTRCASMAGFARAPGPAGRAVGRRWPSACARGFARFWNEAGRLLLRRAGRARRRTTPRCGRTRSSPSRCPRARSSADRQRARRRRVRAAAPHLVRAAQPRAGRPRVPRRATAAARASATAPTTRARSGAGCSARSRSPTLRVHGDPRRPRSFLEPLAHHLADYGVGQHRRDLRRRPAVHAARLHRPGVERRRDAARLAGADRPARARRARQPTPQAVALLEPSVPNLSGPTA